MSGVVSGIRDYGNRVGIPTITGGFFFDEKYTGNCLVNVACLGIVAREDLARNYAGGPDEVMILIGGKTGRDGIHGVNFASADLTATSDEDSRGAVQLADEAEVIRARELGAEDSRELRVRQLLRLHIAYQRVDGVEVALLRGANDGRAQLFLPSLRLFPFSSTT